MIRPAERTTILMLITLTGALSGCASWSPSPRRVGIEPLSPEQQQQLVGQFESNRNQAQRLAALDFWKRGDAASCEASLREILARDQRDAEARRLLADLYLEQGDRAASERELRTLLVHHPEDAAASQALAMLQDGAGLAAN